MRANFLDFVITSTHCGVSLTARVAGAEPNPGSVTNEMHVGRREEIKRLQI